MSQFVIRAVHGAHQAPSIRCRRKEGYSNIKGEGADKRSRRAVSSCIDPFDAVYPPFKSPPVLSSCSTPPGFPVFQVDLARGKFGFGDGFVGDVPASSGSAYCTRTLGWMLPRTSICPWSLTMKRLVSSRRPQYPGPAAYRSATVDLVEPCTAFMERMPAWCRSVQVAQMDHQQVGRKAAHDLAGAAVDELIVPGVLALASLLKWALLRMTSMVSGLDPLSRWHSTSSSPCWGQYSFTR